MNASVKTSFNASDAASRQRNDDAKASLGHLVADRRIVVCVGSGGVGKTTTAAVLALHGAKLGKKTLVITIDPAKRLADALGLASIRSEPRPIGKSLSDLAQLPAGSVLDAMMLDLAQSWDDLVKRSAGSPESADRIIQNPIYRALSRELPGAQEFIACEALQHVAEAGGYDLIVLDTPPTANALDFLDAPARILDMLDSEAFKLFATKAKDGASAARLGLRLFDGAKGAVHAAFSRFTGNEFLDELGEFLVLFREMYQPIKERTRALQALLKSQASSFVIVTSPQPAALAEAAAFQALLQERHFGIGAIIGNRAAIGPWPAPSGQAWSSASVEVCLPARLGASDLSAAIAQAANDQIMQQARDAAHLETLRVSLPGVPFVVVPRLDAETGDAARLVQLLPLLVGT